MTKNAFVVGITIYDPQPPLIAESLKEMGFNVLLLTYDPVVNRDGQLRRYGKIVVTTPWRRLHGKNLRRGVREVLNLAYYFRFSQIKDSLVINVGAEDILMPCDIAYIHFPHFAQYLTGFRYLANCWGHPVTSRKIIGSVLHRKLLKLFLSPCRTVCVNSSFTKHVVDEVLSVNSVVLYPPVITNSRFYTPSDKRNWIVTISRFSREKKLELVLPVAKKVKEGKFFIVGFLHDVEYYRELIQVAKRESIDNVTFLTDVDRHMLNLLLMKSKVYLHTMPYEHFGMSIVEGMAYGLVPVVHKSGGPWMDILGRRQGDYGYAYTDIEEASNYVEELLTNVEAFRDISQRAFKRSLQFSEGAFKHRFKVIVSRFHNLNSYETLTEERGKEDVLRILRHEV